MDSEEEREKREGEEKREKKKMLAFDCFWTSRELWNAKDTVVIATAIDLKGQGLLYEREEDDWVCDKK